MGETSDEGRVAGFAPDIKGKTVMETEKHMGQARKDSGGKSRGKAPQAQEL